MGINLGAFVAPLACGFVAESDVFKNFLASMGFNPAHSWNWAFALAGIGMVLGLTQYLLGAKYLGEAGLYPSHSENQAKDRRNLFTGLGVVGGLVALLAVLALTGAVTLTAEAIASGYEIILGLVVVAFFTWLFTRDYWTPDERKRLYVIAVLFFAAAVFWGAFEQAASTLNLFARDATERAIGSFEVPAAWFQSANAIFIILLAPLFAWLWISLGRRGREPGQPVKFGFGLFFVGLGFVVMVGAALLARDGAVSPLWLLATYFIHTIGELCLSPVGLSAMTRLAPARVLSLMMGVWFLAASIGNYIAGRMAGLYETMPHSSYFGLVAGMAFVAAVILFALAGPIRRMIARG
jgi:POT family proton-dependent oligopeptide transporter